MILIVTLILAAILILIPVAILVPILILKLVLMYVSHKFNNIVDVYTEDGDRILFRNTCNAVHLHCPHPHQ